MNELFVTCILKGMYCLVQQCFNVHTYMHDKYSITNIKVQ